MIRGIFRLWLFVLKVKLTVAAVILVLMLLSSLVGLLRGD